MASLQRSSRASARAIRSLLHFRGLATPAATASSSSSDGPSSSSASSSSSSSTSSWSPRLAPGTCPAYDEALRFISSHQASINRRIAALESSQSSSTLSPQTSAVIDSLRVASQVNDPQVRWAFENTPEDQLDLSNPTVRYLRERAWRKCGSLDRLIERLRNQFILPDSIASLVPTVDVQLIVGSPSGAGVGDHTVQTSDPPPSGDVLAGIVMEQRHLVEKPTLRLTSFEAEKGKLYSLIMVDLDRPVHAHQQEGKLVMYLHWLVLNISLSASETRLGAAESPDTMHIRPYMPPFPAKGTGKHRYVLLLCEQKNPNTATATASTSPDNRLDFDLRGFLATHEMEPVGIHFFRCQWTEHSKETISEMWKQAAREDVVTERQEEVWGHLSGPRTRNYRGQLWYPRGDGRDDKVSPRRPTGWEARQWEVNQSDDSQMDGSEMVGSEMEGSEMEGSEMEGSEMEGSEMEGSEMDGSEMEGSEMEGSEMEGSEMDGSEKKSGGDKL